MKRRNLENCSIQRRHREAITLGEYASYFMPPHLQVFEVKLHTARIEAAIIHEEVKILIEIGCQEDAGSVGRNINLIIERGLMILNELVIFVVLVDFSAHYYRYCGLLLRSSVHNIFSGCTSRHRPTWVTHSCQVEWVGLVGVGCCVYCV